MRLPDWESKFFSVVEKSRHKKFEWGKHDCFTFAVQCEEAINGRTRFPELFTSKYTNAFGANKSFIKHGYRGMLDCINKRCDEVHINMIKRGDWAAIDTPDGIAIGVCIGENIAATGFDGLVFISNKKSKIGWSI